MCVHTHTHIGLASWVCSLGSCTGPHNWKGSVLEVMLCCHLHESIYKFLTRGRTFLFCTWPHKLCSWSNIHIRIRTTLEWSVQLVIQLCQTLCDSMDCSTSGFPVHHQLLEFTQTHVHRVSDAIQPSHRLSSPSPPDLNIFQHQGLFQWVSSSHQVAKV